MVFGREEQVELGFANFKAKENPFTQVGGSSENSENVAAADRSRSIFCNSLPTPAPAPVVDIRPRPPFGFRPSDIPPPNTTSAFGQPISSPLCGFGQPISSSFSPCQNSTSAVHQSSSSGSCSGSQTTAGGQQQSNGGSLFSSRFGIGDQLVVTNPTTAGGVCCSGSFGIPTANCLPTSSSAAPVVDIQPRPLFSFWASDTHPPNSTSAFGQPLFTPSTAFHQPSNPFSGSQTTTGGQQSLFGVQFPSSTTSFNLGGPHDLSPLGIHNSPFSSSISSLHAASQSGGQQSSGGCSLTVSSSPVVSQSGGQHSSGSSLFTHSISSLPTVSQSGGLHSSGWSPFSSVVSSSPAASLSDGQHSSGWSPFSSGISRSLPFGVPLPSSTSLFNVDPLPSSNPFSSGSSVTTSPFLTRLPFSGLVVPTVDARLRASTTSFSGPFTKSLVQENNTSSDRASVFAPFTRSNVRVTDIQGTRLCSYEPTPPAESGFYEIGKLSSISAMPMYMEKSHEELRLEDYQLGLRFPNKSSTDSLPSSIPVISIPLSIEIRHLGDLLATTQITIPVPSSGTVPVSNRARVTESVITSIPEPPSTGFRWPPVEKYKPDDKDVVKFRKFFDVMAMMPKLKCPGYYTVPSMGDLVENELKRPGSCSQVEDFVIGKRGYGSIKFLGETDVRNLDLESIVQFNTREVIFCMDQKTKPPIGQGLNKAAEITLNVDCIDKNTGKRYIDGPQVDKYKELLVRKTMEQGAEFVSFDPVKGEWKFKVQHF